MRTSHDSAGRRLVAAGLALPLILAACAGTTSPGPSGGSPSPTALPSPTPTATDSGASIVVEVTSEGGFINPVASLAALPTVVVYADGRILTQGPPRSDLPDALLPRVTIRDVGPSGAEAIRTAVSSAGLDQPQTGDPGVAADSGTTVFDVPVGAASVTSRFAANGLGGPGLPGGGDNGDNPERTAAFALLDRLLDATDTWGATTVPETTYAPLGYRIYVAPGAPAGGSSPTVPWPLAGDLAAFGSPAIPDLGLTGLRSGVVLGADAATLGPVLAAASTETAFTSGTVPYTLYVRPLLPHELPG